MQENASVVFLRGRGRGRGKPAIRESASIDINNNQQVVEQISQNRTQESVAYTPPFPVSNVPYSTSQFYDYYEDDEDDNYRCVVCDRPDKPIICTSCGHTWRGRVKTVCATHRNTLFNGFPKLHKMQIRCYQGD